MSISSRVWFGAADQQTDIPPQITSILSRGSPGRIALLLPDVSRGGAQQCMLRLAEALVERGFAVDLVLSDLPEEDAHAIPTGVRLVLLDAESGLAGRLSPLRADPAGFFRLLRSVLLPVKASKRLRYVGALARYLRGQRPAVLLSAMTYTNLQALWARKIADVDTRVVVTEHTTLSVLVQRRGARWRHAPALVRRYYRWADSVVAVSAGVADDLADLAGLPRSAVQTIYNPVVGPALFRLAQTPVDHPWFDGGEDVILAAGRLETPKDFPTLLRALAQLRRTRAAKLVILGSGALESSLRDLARQLGVADHVHLAGWVGNPFAYMARARLFVLSSQREGLPTVLIEALACGCPVVATNCPSGPDEILAGGRYGALVPVGDPARLACAMEAALAAPHDRVASIRRGRQFSVGRATDAYLSVLFPVASGTGAAARSTDPDRVRALA